MRQNEKFVKEICTESSPDTEDGFHDHYIDSDSGRPIYMISCQTHLLKKCKQPPPPAHPHTLTHTHTALCIDSLFVARHTDKQT